MNYNKYFFNLILILSLFFSINSSSTKIPYSVEEAPISMQEEEFHPFDIFLEFIGIRREKYIVENILKLKNILNRIPIIISKLFLCNTYLTLDFNYNLLYRMNIKLTPEQKKHLQNKKLRTDLLIIISFEKNYDKNKIVSSKLYDYNGVSASYTYGKRISIAHFRINYDYEISDKNSENIFLMTIIKEIFKALGFRLKYLLKKLIKNKFENVPLYLIEDSEIYKSYKKLFNLNDIEIKNDNESSTDFYQEFWEISSFKFHDIMNNTDITDYVISELTMKIFNEMNHITLPKCDLFKFELGVEKGFNCLRVSQDCIGKNEEKNYFLEYGTYNKTKIKCYLNTKENIKKEQCGINYGNLEYNNFHKYFTPAFKQIKNLDLLAKREIPEINLYKNQTLKLLKNPPSCKKGTPRTVFFQVPPNIFEDKKNESNITTLINELEEINKNVEYDEITLGEKDKKYFVTYEAYEDNYKRECVLKVLNYSGIIRSFSDLYSHNFLIKNPQSSKLMEMGYIPSLQKLFSINNFEVIAYKDLTYKYYYLMKKQFPKDYNYMPETYSYPQEKNEIIKKFRNYKLSKEDLWLIKPKKASLGKGIHIFHTLQDTPNDYIITKYISHPHLINDLKYDFRLYVLITGFSPLKIYLYKEGLVRFTTEKYSLDLNKIDELYRHLTNVAINTKNTNTYKKALDADTEEGSKWSLEVYKHYCEHNGIDFNKLWKQMADITIKSILAVKDLFIKVIKSNGTKDKNHFKLFGYDFMVDENLKVDLIEVNSRPSLFMKDIIDLRIKPQLIADTLNIVGITPYSHDFNDDFEAYDGYNEENISDDEDGVDRALCEFGRPRGRFELIFPLKENYNYYKKFYKDNKYADEMLWKKLNE